MQYTIPTKRKQNIYTNIQLYFTNKLCSCIVLHMVRAKTQPPEDSMFGFDGELVILAIPAILYKDLSDIAAKKGKTVAQALEAAMAAYLKEV